MVVVHTTISYVQEKCSATFEDKTECRPSFRIGLMRYGVTLEVCDNDLQNNVFDNRQHRSIFDNQYNDMEIFVL